MVVVMPCATTAAATPPAPAPIPAGVAGHKGSPCAKLLLWLHRRLPLRLLVMRLIPFGGVARWVGNGATPVTMTSLLVLRLLAAGVAMLMARAATTTTVLLPFILIVDVPPAPLAAIILMVAMGLITLMVMVMMVAAVHTPAAVILAASPAAAPLTPSPPVTRVGAGPPPPRIPSLPPAATVLLLILLVLISLLLVAQHQTAIGHLLLCLTNFHLLPLAATFAPVAAVIIHRRPCSPPVVRCSIPSALAPARLRAPGFVLQQYRRCIGSRGRVECGWVDRSLPARKDRAQPSSRGGGKMRTKSAGLHKRPVLMEYPCPPPP